MQHPIFAIGLPHGSEWLIILVLAVLFFGADKLPKLARGLGKSLGEFKKAKEDFEKEIHSASTETEVKKPEQQNLISGNVPAAVTPVAPVTPVNTATSVDELTKKI
jgi:sec-independent protein translocase protein TatA